MPKQDKRYRTFMLILYKDDEKYFDYLNFIIDKEFKNQNYRYAGIVHDKDINEDTGELKKEHEHIVLYFDNPRTITSISKEMELPPQYIEKYSSLKTALLYLLHYNQGDKVQYNFDEVYGDLKNELKKYITNTPSSEEERVLKVLDIIDNYYKYTSYSKFLRDVCNNGLYDILRRNNYIFIKILDKHNETFYNNK